MSMEISQIFKEAIANTFYDKDIEIWRQVKVEDDEGAIVENGKTEKIDSFKGNFQFKTREKLKREYGEEVEANAIVTCDRTKAKIGDILVYNGKEYEIKSIVPSDSHMTLIVFGGETDE